MKVIKVSNPANLENLSIFDSERPSKPQPNEVMVRIHASSLNFHDYAIVAGFMPTAVDRIPMADGSGVVVEVGEKVTEFAVGDHVVSCFFPGWDDGVPVRPGFSTVPGDGVDGFASEFVVRPANWFTKAPVGYSHVEAATIPTAAVTAWRALVVNGGLKAGDTVLVMGTGGVSIFALQIAKMMGAKVIATSSSEEKLARLKNLGADETINYREYPDWGIRAFNLASGKGVDHVVEIGGTGSLPQSISAAKVGGHIALIGVLAGMKGEVPMAPLLMKQVRLQGLLVGNRKNQIDLIKAIEINNLKPIVDRSFPFSDIKDAFKYQISGAHFGKICLEF